MKNDIEATGPSDAHAHVFLRTDKSVPDARYIPNYDASLDSWLATLDANSLTGGTLVQPSFLGTDNSRLLTSIKEARAQGHKVDGAAVVSPDASQGDLETLSKQGIAALRLNLVERPLPELRHGHWPGFFELTASMGLVIEIHLEASRMLQVLEVIQKTNAIVTLDHYALVDSVHQLEHLLRNCNKGTLSIKRSAPYRLPVRNIADSESLVDDLDNCLSSYLSPEQTPWGSDWPHTRFENLKAGNKSLSGQKV